MFLDLKNVCETIAEEAVVKDGAVPLKGSPGDVTNMDNGIGMTAEVMQPCCSSSSGSGNGSARKSVTVKVPVPRSIGSVKMDPKKK